MAEARRAPDQAAAWDGLVEQFVDRYLELHPGFAVAEGAHAFDGQLPDWAPSGLERTTEMLREFRDEARAVDTAALDEERRIEQEHLLAVTEGELFWLDEAEFPWRHPGYYSSGLSPDVYLTRPYAPAPERMQAFIRWARALPTAVEQIRENLTPPLPRTFRDFGHTSFGGMAGYLREEVPGSFPAVEDEDLQQGFREAALRAATVLEELDAWLADVEVTDDPEAYALGADRYRRMLRTTERLEVPLDQLEAAGRRELERNLEALREACGTDDARSVRRCVEEMKAAKPDEGPVERARRQLDRLEAFVRDSGAVSVPDGGDARVAPSPPHMRWNTAYIDIPGPFEEGVPSFFYIAPPDPGWTEDEQAAYVPGRADLLSTAIHEVWPGHHLQYLHSNRAPSLLGRLFVTYGFTEGWAHYAEELVLELGLAEDDPEVRVGQLVNALLRNVRYLAALGLHTGRMTVEDAERMFREQAFQDPANARQQAARGTFDPAYLNYTLGKMVVRKLREDWMDRHDDGDLRRFHDELLSRGGPPLGLLRTVVLGDDEAELL